MLIKNKTKYASVISLACLGFFATPAVNAQIVADKALKFCSQIAVFGPSKPADCLNDAGEYINPNGQLSNNRPDKIEAPKKSPDLVIDFGANKGVPGKGAIKDCDKVAVFGGGSKPTNCFDRNGNLVDANGNVTNEISIEVDRNIPGTIRQCDKVAVFGGGSKPTNCMDRNGNYIDAGGRVQSQTNIGSSNNQTNNSKPVAVTPKPTNVLPPLPASSSHYQCDQLAMADVKVVNCFTKNGGFIDKNGKEIVFGSNSNNPKPVPVTPKPTNVLPPLPASSSHYQCDQLAMADVKVVNCFTKNGGFIDKNGDIVGNGTGVIPTKSNPLPKTLDENVQSNNNNTNSGQQCDKMAVFGPSKPTNCYDRNGNFVDGSVEGANNVQSNNSNTNSGQQCDKMAVFGPSKPTNCYDRNGNFVDGSGNVQGANNIQSNNSNTNSGQQCDKMAVFGPSKPTNCYDRNGNFVDGSGNVQGANNIQSNNSKGGYKTESVVMCSQIAVFGPSKPTNCVDNTGRYVSGLGDDTSKGSNIMCGGNITKNCHTSSDGYIDNDGKTHNLETSGVLNDTTLSVLACENVVNNISLKGHADYLALWEPPQGNIEDVTYSMEPIFNPADLVYNNINYGKVAVLLSKFNKTNSRTGAVSSLNESPVAMNNCNIKWKTPSWVAEEVARRANIRASASNNSGGAVFGGTVPGTVQKDTFIGIDAEGYRHYTDGSREKKTAENDESNKYMLDRLKNNTEGGYGMGWEDMEWDASSGFWVKSGKGRDMSQPVY